MVDSFDNHWKADWRVKHHADILIAIYESMCAHTATKEDTDRFFQVCWDMEAFIILSETILFEHKKPMIKYINELKDDFKKLAAEYQAVMSLK